MTSGKRDTFLYICLHLRFKLFHVQSLLQANIYSIIVVQTVLLA